MAKPEAASLKPLNNLQKKANKTLKKLEKIKKNTPLAGAYIIESESGGMKIREVIFGTESDIAAKIKNGRIDPKEKVYEAQLTPINKKNLLKKHGI